jgi:hypothetical protein
MLIACSSLLLYVDTGWCYCPVSVLVFQFEVGKEKYCRNNQRRIEEFRTLQNSYNSSGNNISLM